MKIYGMLENASLEVLSADPSSTATGRKWFNSTTNKAMLDDGVNKRALLRNDQYLVIGNNATAANNVRINRCANATLQFVPGSDTTAEGSLSASPAQLDFRLANYATAGRPAAGNMGRVYFDTTALAFLYDNGTNWIAQFTDPTTTKGDLLVNNGAAAARFAVSPTNGMAFCADSTASQGVSYQALSNYKNHLVNGAFDYWQVGTSGTIAAIGGATPSPSYFYLADQWYVNNILGGSTTEGVITFSQVTGVTNGSQYGAKVQITTAPAGTGVQNGCELYQTLSSAATVALYGQTVSFSVLVKALGNVNQVGVQFFYHATTEAKVTTAIGSEVLTTVNSSTFTACTINGQALGTAMGAGGSVGVRIRITGVSSGNAYALNNGFVCEQAILNLGPVAMPFSRQYSDPACELVSCQYFYEKSYPTNTAPGTVTGAGCGRYFSASTASPWFSIPFKVTKHPGGAFQIYSTNTGAAGEVFDSTGTTDVALNVGSADQSCAAASISATAGHLYLYHWVMDARI